MHRKMIAVKRSTLRPSTTIALRVAI
jgi:hypothetical protein